MRILAIAIGLAVLLEVTLLTMMYATGFGPCGPNTLLGGLALMAHGPGIAVSTAVISLFHPAETSPIPFVAMVETQSMTWIAAFWFLLTKLAARHGR